MKLKSIVIVNDFDFVQGGASKVAIQTANMLAESNRKLNVYFFCAVHDDKSPLNKRVIKVCTNQSEALQYKDKLHGIINGVYNFKAKRKLKKLLKSLNRDETIIHIHGWTKALSSSIFSAVFKSKFTIVLTLHDYFTACPNGGFFNYVDNEICTLKPMSWKCIKCNCDSRNYAFKLYRIFRQLIQNNIVGLNKKITDVITISDFSENILKNTLNSFVKIHRVYNPIDLDLNPPKINYKKNKYFLYVGRISREKGVDVFCQAVTKTKQEGIVVGDGPELKSLKQKYSNIRFAGWKNETEVKKYMQSAKAIVIPSLLYECAPLTPLEALQYKIPVFTSHNATIDYLGKDNAQFIFNDADDLSQKINLLAANKLRFNFNSKLIDERRNYYQSLWRIYSKIKGANDDK